MHKKRILLTGTIIICFIPEYRILGPVSENQSDVSQYRSDGRTRKP